MAIAHLAGSGVATYFLTRDGTSVRDGVLIACSVICLGRLLLTSFYLLRRGVGWSEAAEVAPFLFAVQAALGYLGAGGTVPWRAIDWVGLCFFAAGSCLNSGSELQRLRWKAAPGHEGRLYREGLFSLSMHVNYFGDVVLFTGFALLTASAWAFLVPLVMTAGFVLIHIPALDRHLAQKYPGEFEEWSRSTRKLIPFVY